ncbi:DUF2269 family protein [Bacillus sp. KH172YL63]|uniref:DUF2269 family protein n=1 Tax=Bacillus sp. KH172YL63 TaxID=2709784 RepID=UPI0013E48891|nr:DUF2269 family protein [Bacillus sp. KH172YL63]BCB02238.1 hypothetical protein KH172YL63_03710 [Bacillus sp. KH172YL63]
MKALVLVHVLSAIIGIGPTFFTHVLTRPSQNVEQLKVSMALYQRLEFFPKIGGSLALLTGFILFFAGDYGPFTQLWIAGSFTLYLLIQLSVFLLINPNAKKVSTWLTLPENEFLTGAPPEEIQRHLSLFNRYMYMTSALGVLLFICMILKP